MRAYQHSFGYALRNPGYRKYPWKHSAVIARLYENGEVAAPDMYRFMRIYL